MLSAIMTKHLPVNVAVNCKHEVRLSVMLSITQCGGVVLWLTGCAYLLRCTREDPSAFGLFSSSASAK